MDKLSVFLRATVLLSFISFLASCGYSNQKLSEHDLEEARVPGYIVISTESGIEDEIWVNFFDFKESKLLKLNAKNLEATEFVKDSAIINISFSNFEYSYTIRNTFYPGDTIAVILNKKHYPILTLKNREYNHVELNYITFLNEAFIGIDDFAGKIFTTAVLKPELIDKIKTGQFLSPVISYEKSKEFLEHLLVTKQISNNFYGKTSAYQHISFLNGVVQSKNETFIKTYLNDINLKDTTLLNEDYYLDFLYNLAINDIEKDFTKKNHYRYYLRCEEKYSGKVRDAVLLHSLFQLALGSNKEEILKAAKRFITTCEDPTMIDYVKKELLSTPQKVEISTIKTKVIDTDNNEFESIHAVLRNTDAELFYLDFWASWCAPCLAEMPHSKKLKQEYQNRGVAFLYLSIDSDIEKWKKSVQRIALPAKDSYLLVNGYDSELGKKLNISSIPRYIIFDKTGKVVDDNAPRPSDPTIGSVLDKLLKIKDLKIN